MNASHETKPIDNHTKRFDYNLDKERTAYRVNEKLGLKGGGNLCIAQGRVLYKREQDARREEVINVPDSFYRK